MDWIQNYQFFLFDFDGLLVDTEKLHFAAYVELCYRHGYQLNWSFHRFCTEAHSKPMGVWEALVKECPHLYEKKSREELYEEKKSIYVELLKKTPLEFMQGAADLLKALAKNHTKRAVVTNSPRLHVEIVKQSLPLLQTIPLWITREDYLYPKPAPDGYLQAIKQLATSSDRMIGFEDSLKGLKALLAAGVEGVLICPKEYEYVKESKLLGAKHFETLSLIS